MKLFKVTFLFILLSFSSFAKDSTTVEFKRFALGIHASPDYCFRNVASLNGSHSYRDEMEVPMWSYTGGIDFSYFIKKRFAVSLGVNFSQKGYSTRELEITTVDHPEGGIGKCKYRFNYNYIGIPVKANFVFGKKKVRFITGVGVTSAFLLYQQINSKTEYYDGSKETKKGEPNYIYNPFNLFLNGSVGVDFKLGKKMGLKIEPTYSYGLFETTSSYYSERLWSAGLNIGCYIKF